MFLILATRGRQSTKSTLFSGIAVLLYTLAPPSGQTKKHRRVLKGSGDRELCQEQYLFWLLASKMAAEQFKTVWDIWPNVNPLRYSQTLILLGLSSKNH